MKITILTYGSRGDVQPFLPLSLGLMEKGHAVKLAAPFRFKILVEEHGINFVPLAGDSGDLSRRLNYSVHNFIRIIRELMSHAFETGSDLWHAMVVASNKVDLIHLYFTLNTL